MQEDPEPHSGRFDEIADFYGPAAGSPSDPLHRALETWDHNEYRTLQEHDPELYGLLCRQIGHPIDIHLGSGSVRVGLGGRLIDLTWNGDDEDLLDLVLEAARMIGDPGP